MSRPFPRGFAASFDLAGGTAQSVDRSIRLVAEIRLDNRPELIARLTGDGISPGSDPDDAGLVLAAYRRWGTDCAAQLIGDFAFALWDDRKRQLFAACDPLGVKPLHYARVGSTLCVATEAQQVLRHCAVPVKLDEVAAGEFLLDGAFEPDRTFFQGVHRLPPGHRLVARLDSQCVERFWDLDPDARTVYRNDADYAEHFLELFHRSVADRLGSGSTGVLMSGGLDSCSVAAVASRALPADGSRRLFNVSFVFDNLGECDERTYIQSAADGLGLESCLIPADRFQLLDGTEAGRPDLEGPPLAWDACFHEALRQTRDRGARVLLTGHGGDDLLAGTVQANGDRLRRGDARVLLEVGRHAIAQRWAWRWIVYTDLIQPLVPAVDRIFRRQGRTPELPDWIDPGFAHRTDLLGRLSPRRTVAGRSGERARLLWESHLRRTPWDRAAAWYDQHAAAYGIEVRHPFLDRRLLEYLASIPPGQLFRTGASKPLLRRAMAGILPEAVRLRRGKTQFGAVHGQAMAARKRVERLLVSPWVERLGFVDGNRLRAAWSGFQENRSVENGVSLWHTIALELWLREHQTTLGIDLPSTLSRTAA